MIAYLVKFSFCLAIFLAFHKLFLERENMHVFKRYYLLATLFLAIGIPFITFTTYITPVEVTPLTNELTPAPEVLPLLTPTNSSSSYIPMILWGIYGLGVFVFGVKFVRNLLNITGRIRKNPKSKVANATLVLMKEDVNPHSFWHYIFFNRKRFESGTIPKEVIWHEKVHVQQRHSLDILIVEVLKIFFWFHPLVYFAKSTIKLNHEFLADQTVLQKGVLPSVYQNVLLAFSTTHNAFQLTSAFSYLSIKKRFIVMKSHTSKYVFAGRIALLVPVVAFTLYSFSSRTIVQKEAPIEHTESTTQIATKTPVQKQKSISTHSSGKVPPETYFAETRFKLYEKGIVYRDTIIGVHKLIDKSYSELTSEEKNKTFRFSLMIPKPYTKMSPSKVEMKRYQNAKTYAIWIDGENVPNTELQKYNSKDFAYYSAPMTITKKGRSKKYPQPFWCMFYTHEYFAAKKMGEQKTKYTGTQIAQFNTLEKRKGNYSK